ncbi:MAG TPA: transketolase C-terminal domain-containing protein, partial [Candidatus Acidoferrales bacterium]|nr:transketolase C-terminal domain-containing protein [Candidatus Acidoferrales bacterium]
PILFEEMGMRYLGPIDGHNLPLLVTTLEFAKTCDHPIVIHILTQKGKGFEAALKFPEKFHGLGPYDAKTGETPAPKPNAPPNYQDVMGQTLVKLCRRDNRLVGITAAMPSGTGLKHLEKEMPDRYYDVGIAEEHAVIFAAGMATTGFHPVVAIYSTFLQRAYDCIHHDVCLQDLPVIFCMDRAGLSANDGPTHHGLFDISYLRCLPNVIAMAPANEDELADMMYTATHQNHPAFIRYPRGTAEGVPVKDLPKLLEIGKAEIVRHFSNNGKKKIAIFGLGNMNSLASKAAAQLAAEDFDCAVINPRFTKPLDAGTHEFFGRAADLIVTMEDHVLMGGYGSAVLELFNEKNVKNPMVRIGWPDQFIEHATSQDELRKRYGLTVENMVSKVKEHFSESVETATVSELPAAI